MNTFHLANAIDLKLWADHVQARYDFPELIRRLVLATSKPSYIEFRAQEGTGYGGWDGRVEACLSTPFVPKGISAWELGTGIDVASKANEDFNKRTEEPNPFDPKVTTYIFCSPRRWERKDDWIKKREKAYSWKAIRVYDADDLITWLANAPGVHVWFSIKIGKPVLHVQDLSSWWSSWSTITSPQISSSFFLSGREVVGKYLTDLIFEHPKIITLRGESSQEILAFVASVLLENHQETGDLNRTLIVENESAWRFFSSQEKPLILIPKFFDANLANQAVKNGHHVIVPLEPDHSLDVTVEVPRLNAIKAQELLESTGVASVTARHLAALARRSFAAYRRTRAANVLDTPDWAKGDDGVICALLTLVGAWNETVDGDKEIIEKLSGFSYIEIKRRLIRWNNTAEGPFRLVGSCWNANAKEDAWRLLSKRVSSEDLDKFSALVMEVLSELDLQRGLSTENLLLADLEGKRLRYSPVMREGLSDTIAMLGALGALDPPVSISDGYTTSGWANQVVQGLIAKVIETPEIWLDFASHLSAFAEAAPDLFLGAIERDLKLQKPSSMILFEPQFGFITPNYHHTYLLWALENLAWSPIYFSRVSYILAKLVILAPETEVVNSPFESLMSFFRLWMPQCGADVDLRLRTLDHIRKEWPNVAWDLMLSLLPSGRDFVMRRSGPGARAVLWRDWLCEAKRPTREEFSKSTKFIFERILIDVDRDSTRWIALINYLPDFEPGALEQAMEKLGDFVANLQDHNLKYDLWQKLRSFLARHREFPNADWSAPEGLLNRLEEILSFLTPTDPAQKYRWLFDRHVRIVGNFASYQERQNEVELQRKIALQAIISSKGIEGLFNFAECVEVPFDIGVTLFGIGICEEKMNQIIASLERNGPHREVGRGVICRASHGENDEWVNKHLNAGTIASWDIEARVSALTCFPMERKTLEFLELLDQSTRKGYWRSINHIWTDDPEIFTSAIQNLIRYNCPRRAVEILAMYHDSRKFRLDYNVVQQALNQSLVTSIDEDSQQIDSHNVAVLLVYLSNHTDSDKDLLEKLEWSYLPHIRHEYGLYRLISRLNEEPNFFVEIVGMIYDRTSSKIDSQNMTRAYGLISSWNVIPGTQADGTLDEDYLKEWINKSVSLLESKNLTDKGLGLIGQMLAQGAKQKDHIWPEPIICELIQEIANDHLDNHFRVGIHNSRGVTSRDPFDGGEQEREIAKSYKEKAALLDAEWPRVGAILRRLAEDYLLEAIRHDQRSERDEDNLG